MRKILRRPSQRDRGVKPFKVRFPAGVVFSSACTDGDTKVAKKALLKGVDVNTQDYHDMTGLHYVSRHLAERDTNSKHFSPEAKFT